MSDNAHELESTLRALGSDIAYPATPNMTAAVMHRVGPVPRPAPIARGPRFRLALVAAAVLAIATVATVGLSPTARRAVADWLGVEGVRITFDDSAPDLPSNGDPAFGRKVSLAEAEELVDFDIAIPAELGEPDAVYFMDVQDGEVSLLWEPEPGLPESEHTGVGAVLTQFRGRPDPLGIKKVLESSDVRFLTIDGGDAFFIEGAPHVIILTPDGGAHEQPPRLAGNTLLWEGEDVTYRLEAEVSLGRAETIAESLE